jgi:FAD-dependent urate hydroxylase
MEGRKAIIIGAGPGGLTAAIALRQAGFDPVVYERSVDMREIGSGLTLWPNAMMALERIGLADAVREVSLPPTGIAMRSWRGELLFDVMSNEQMEDLFGVYGAALHRAELQSVLLRTLGDDIVKLGSRCVGLQQSDSGVAAHFDDGRIASGEILIAADGIRSVIRGLLFGERRLRYAGYTVWRGVTDFRLDQNTVLTSMGRGAQFGIFPMTRDRVYWFASVNAPEGDSDWAVGRKRELLERFGGWHKPIREIIEATDEPAILRNDIYDQEPLSRWSDRRVTLLGDAAHPSTPNLGQGACQAIEDAVVLGGCLRDEPDVITALRKYETRRLARTSSITMQSRRMGRVGTWKNPVACWFRDKLIKSTPENVWLQQLSRMLRFEG